MNYENLLHLSPEALSDGTAVTDWLEQALSPSNAINLSQIDRNADNPVKKHLNWVLLNARVLNNLGIPLTSSQMTNIIQGTSHEIYVIIKQIHDKLPVLTNASDSTKARVHDDTSHPKAILSTRSAPSPTPLVSHSKSEHASLATAPNNDDANNSTRPTHTSQVSHPFPTRSNSSLPSAGAGAGAGAAAAGGGNALQNVLAPTSGISITPQQSQQSRQSQQLQPMRPLSVQARGGSKSSNMPQQVRQTSLQSVSTRSHQMHQLQGQQSRQSLVSPSNPFGALSVAISQTPTVSHEHAIDSNNSHNSNNTGRTRVHTNSSNSQYMSSKDQDGYDSVSYDIKVQPEDSARSNVSRQSSHTHSVHSHMLISPKLNDSSEEETDLASGRNGNTQMSTIDENFVVTAKESNVRSNAQNAQQLQEDELEIRFENYTFVGEKAVLFAEKQQKLEKSVKAAMQQYKSSNLKNLQNIVSNYKMNGLRHADTLKDADKKEKYLKQLENELQTLDTKLQTQYEESVTQLKEQLLLVNKQKLRQFIQKKLISIPDTAPSNPNKSAAASAVNAANAAIDAMDTIDSIGAGGVYTSAPHPEAPVAVAAVSRQLSVASTSATNANVPVPPERQMSVIERSVAVAADAASILMKNGPERGINAQDESVRDDGKIRADVDYIENATQTSRIMSRLSSQVNFASDAMHRDDGNKPRATGKVTNSGNIGFDANAAGLNQIQKSPQLVGKTQDQDISECELPQADPMHQNGNETHYSRVASVSPSRGTRVTRTGRVISKNNHSEGNVHAAGSNYNLLGTLHHVSNLLERCCNEETREDAEQMNKQEQIEVLREVLNVYNNLQRLIQMKQGDVKDMISMFAGHMRVEKGAASSRRAVAHAQGLERPVPQTISDYFDSGNISATNATAGSLSTHAPSSIVNYSSHQGSGSIESNLYGMPRSERDVYGTMEAMDATDAIGRYGEKRSESYGYGRGGKVSGGYQEFDEEERDRVALLSSNYVATMNQTPFEVTVTRKGKKRRRTGTQETHLSEIGKEKKQHQGNGRSYGMRSSQNNSGNGKKKNGAKSGKAKASAFSFSVVHKQTAASKSKARLAKTKSGGQKGMRYV